MATCELCGAAAGQLKPVTVAGSTMHACSSCQGMGSLNKSSTPSGKGQHTFVKKKKEESTLEVVGDYDKRINDGLKKKGLNFHQLAKALNIKESFMNKFVQGKLKPDVSMAERIGKYLDITLLETGSHDPVAEEKLKEEMVVDESKDTSKSTLGDLIKSELNKKQ